MPTLADALTNATAAVNANAQTYFDQEQRVALREATLVKVAGGVPADGDATELARFAARGILISGLGNLPNAPAGSLPNGVVFPNLEPWVRLRGIASQTNTSSSVTMTVTGIPTAVGFIVGSLFRRDGSALAPGDISVGVPFGFQPDGTGAFRMTEAVASEIAASVTTISTTVVNAAVAGLKAAPWKKYVAGTYQVDIPVGAVGCKSKAWGGGGSSGGIGSTNNGSASGGGGGGYSYKVITGLTGGGKLPVVVGAGAAPGGQGGAGGTGGTTTVGSYHSATGGGPGSPNGPGTGGPGGNGIGGDVNLTGGYGSAGASTGAGTGGQGGGTSGGGGQGGGGAPGIGAPGTSPGGGGGGPGSTTVNPGAYGADGGVELEWF